MSWGFQYREYVPVARKKSQARAYAGEAAKEQGRKVQPVSIQGNKIAKTFWGQAWCEHLESYSDFASRLPRGRTYVRNGSVVDLLITAGRLDAIVAGSDPYDVTVEIARLKPAKWKKIQRDCTESIDSLLDLLGGRLSDGVMQRLTDRSDGLFPAPSEIEMTCSCPDWAGLCKHLAAVLYGVGALLDQQPELLFLLRGVNHHELVGEAVSEENLSTAFGEPSTDLDGEDLGAVFGIELDTAETPTESKRSPKKKRAAAKKSKRKPTAAKKTARKKSAKAKPARKKASAKKSAKSRKGAKTTVKKKATKKKAATKAAAKKKSTKKKAAKKKATAKKTTRKQSKKSTS